MPECTQIQRQVGSGGLQRDLADSLRQCLIESIHHAVGVGGAHVSAFYRGEQSSVPPIEQLSLIGGSINPCQTESLSVQCGFFLLRKESVLRNLRINKRTLLPEEGPDSKFIT